MEFRQLFGNENAPDDDLLEECYVPPPGLVLGRPILIGKWGTGKTGLLLHRNANLSRALRSFDRRKDRIWYLNETGIQLQTLKQIEKLSGNDSHTIKRLLEDIWKSEILRTAASVLVELRTYYGFESAHWEKLAEVFKATTSRTIWELVPSTFSIFLPGDRGEALKDFIEKLRTINNDLVFDCIQSCLSDIAHHQVQPVVAIEPIETPTSPVEDQTDLAQLLVTCLLNVYYKNFLPSSRQLLSVEISIPWHRYLRDQVGEPQKLYPFIGRFRWTKSSLRAFINKRIEWEFRRIKRAFFVKGNLDAWSILFPDTVRNALTRKPENTFDYVIRHSQYRVRDVLRLSREAVEHEAVNRNESLDEVLAGRGGVRISERSIRAAVIKTCRGTSTERVLEGTRRFPGLDDTVEALRGMSVPFTIDEFKKRLQKRAKIENQASLWKNLDNLWNAGIIGLQLIGSTHAAVAQLKASFESGPIAQIDSGENQATFYIFEYFTEKSISDIINTYDGSEGKSEHTDISLRLVVHPMLFEFLDVRVNEDRPIGV